MWLPISEQDRVKGWEENGRIEETRTPDPHVPNVVRYQLRYYPNAKPVFRLRCKGTKKNSNARFFAAKNMVEAPKTCFFWEKRKKIGKMFGGMKKTSYLCNRKRETNLASIKNLDGAIAQLVEQRTENPCVPGSIPGGTTKRKWWVEPVSCIICACGFFYCG